MSPTLEVLIAAYILYRKSSDALKELDPATLQHAGWFTWGVLVARMGYFALVSTVCVIAGWMVILKGT